MTEPKEWYSLGEIRFTRQQVIWLIKQLSIIRGGKWPSDHKETGYTGKSKDSFGHSSYFEKPVQVAADLDSRIERAGIDGILAEFVFTVDPEDRHYLESHIANAMRLDLKTVNRRINTALKYIKGKCPRWLDCDGCLFLSECMKRKSFKKRKGVGYNSFKQHRRGSLK